MTNTPGHSHIQLVLFEEDLSVPSLCDFSEDTREEIVRELAELLGRVRKGNTECNQILRGQGE